jgi:hypothetical protein
MMANMRTMGEAEGTIMATIITVHMTNVKRKSKAPQDCIWGMDISIPMSMFIIPQAR